MADFLGGARGMELAGDGRGAGQALLRGHLSTRPEAMEQPPERSPQGEPAPRWSKLGVHEEKKDSLEGGCWGVLGGEGEVVRGAVVGCGSLDPLWQDLGLSDPPGRSSPNSIRMRWLARCRGQPTCHAWPRPQELTGHWPVTSAVVPKATPGDHFREKSCPLAMPGDPVPTQPWPPTGPICPESTCLSPSLCR